MDKITNRKGATSQKDISQNVLELLNLGKIESKNLIEWLSIDHIKLLESNFLELGISDNSLKIIFQNIKDQKKKTALSTTKLIASNIYDLHFNTKSFDTVLKNILSHSSDSIRSYGAYIIALDQNLSIEEKLQKAKELIKDKNPQVREIVWIALRPSLESELKKSIKILRKFAKDKDENIRRFASESIRPRGVWCSHIKDLKENPTLAIDILEELRSDTSVYVQKSLANWLNDASKSKPEFVLELCDRWAIESDTKETKRIIKRAKRTLVKQAL